MFWDVLAIGLGVPACPGCSPSTSSPHFSNSLLLSLQSALTLRPEKVLVHQWDRMAPKLKPINSTAKPRALSLAGKALHD